MHASGSYLQFLSTRYQSKDLRKEPGRGEAPRVLSRQSRKKRSGGAQQPQHHPWMEPGRGEAPRVLSRQSRKKRSGGAQQPQHHPRMEPGRGEAPRVLPRQSRKKRCGGAQQPQHHPRTEPGREEAPRAHQTRTRTKRSTQAAKGPVEGVREGKKPRRNTLGGERYQPHQQSGSGLGSGCRRWAGQY